jgi:hypothetical protein
MDPGAHRRHPKLGVRATAGVRWSPLPGDQQDRSGTGTRIPVRWEEYGIGIAHLDDERRELLTMEQLSKRLPDV